MPSNYIAHGLAAIVSLFFVVGGLINIIAPAHITQDYERWGYPNWFHYLTGFLELLAALLIIIPMTRIAGSALGGAVMVAAVATLIWHGSFPRAIVPSVALLIIAANALLTSRLTG